MTSGYPLFVLPVQIIQDVLGVLGVLDVLGDILEIMRFILLWTFSAVLDTVFTLYVRCKV